MQMNLMPEFKIFYGIKISVINNYIFQHSQEIFLSNSGKCTGLKVFFF